MHNTKPKNKMCAFPEERKNHISYSIKKFQSGFESGVVGLYNKDNKNINNRNQLIKKIYL